mmetsp:Transcript_11675/g.11714  ORF Transcript_11675/g.11714 Transcript_11675/m.11714 type:complete len:362 (+) Transcript_11675:174-1259(+)
MGVQKDITMNLPMGCIGGVEHSFQGCILDCRYWAKPRSSLQINKQDMHKLISFNEEVLPASRNLPGRGGKVGVVKKLRKKKEEEAASPEGLIGWWTFEDGRNSTRVTDVSGHRFRCLIKSDAKNRFRWLAAEVVSMSNAMSQGVFVEPPPLPVPSYRERNLCPFEIRRYKLAERGRMLLRDTECPLGCDVPIRRIDTRFHVRFECEKRRVQCRMPQCGAMFALCNREKHEAKWCVAIKAREELLDKAKQQNALVPCSMCSEQIRTRDLDLHESEQCAYRYVTCPHEDCQEEVAAHELKYHLSHKCMSEAVTRRTWLIERARRRRGYPRPWGYEIPLDEEFNDSSSEDSVEDYPSPTTRRNK